jgi:hypothetical protein
MDAVPGRDVSTSEGDIKLSYLSASGSRATTFVENLENQPRTAGKETLNNPDGLQAVVKKSI